MVGHHIPGQHVVLWKVLAVLPVAAAYPFTPQDYKPPEGKRSSCQCTSREGERVTSLFDDSQNKVVNALLVPGELKPEDIQRMQQLEYWSSQKDMMDWKNITEGCPRGFVSAEPSRPPANAAPAGSYWEQVDWTVYEEAGFDAAEVSKLSKNCFILRQCPHGYYCALEANNEWSPQPRVCGKGTVCDQMGLKGPVLCDNGWFCPNPLSKEPCVLGFHCPQGTYVPELCEKGYHCNAPWDQEKCPKGHWCPEGTSEPKKCPWWSRCPEGAETQNWWAVGLTIAITVPVLFETLLGSFFLRQVHEQVVLPHPKGMTLPCAGLLLSSLTLAWFLMPEVALIQTGVFAYAVLSVSTSKILHSLRLVLLPAFAFIIGYLFGATAAVWMLYIPTLLFAGFLCNSPQLANRRRGLKGLCFLFVSFTVMNTSIVFRMPILPAVIMIYLHCALFPCTLLYFFRAEVHRQLLPTAETVDRLPGISFELENVGLAVGPSRKPVLQDISLKIEGDSSCALMGPSGSGKSSLLNVLTGRALLYGEVSGCLFANGESIPEGIEARSKNATGFVPQDDVMHTNLTVYENVYFSARLRLPPSTPAQEVVATVEQVLKDVQIWHVKDTPIGNADLRGISGGQRKRASIAMELVGRPSILFLDEPTTGLDASAAHSIIKLVCNKSQLSCTSIAVIHQPRWQTLACFDQVVLLATGGYLVYSGPVADSVTYFTQVLGLKLSDGDNPADLFLDLIGAEASQPENIASKWTSQISRQSSDQPQLPLSAYDKTRPGVSETFWILCLRCCLQVCRLRLERISNLCLVALFLLLMRILLGEGGDFEHVLMQLGIGQSMLMLPVCIHALHIFSCDRLERLREDIAGIPTLPQYLAKDICHFVETLSFAAVWAGIYGPFSHLGVSPWMMLRVSVAQSYLAFGISFFLSVNLPSQSTATVTVMLFLVVAQLCSGVDMISFKDMHFACGGVGWLIFILSPSFYTVQRFLPIMLNDTMTPPVKDAVCNGYLNQKGVKCDRLNDHRYTKGWTLWNDIDSSYIFLHSDIQLVMFGLAIRAVAFLQMQLRAVGLKGSYWQLGLRYLLLVHVTVFFVMTLPRTHNEPHAWL